MKTPAYKIEVWEPGAGSALYTIERKVMSLYTKEVLTSGVGHFKFTIPTKRLGSTYFYKDIDLYDTVKIWLDWDSVSGDPDFVGKIFKIAGPLAVEHGFIREISGLSQGEVLLRQLKKNTLWEATNASVIATAVANDLGLGTSQIDVDTTDVDLDVETKTYMDVLQRISDYWYSAGNKIRKDFYVDADGDLVWKARPFRTVGVESLAIGANIKHYRVLRDVTPVKRNISVFGVRDKRYPVGKDLAESTANWSGDTISQQTDRKIGSYSIQNLKTASSDQNIMSYYDSALTVPCDRWKKHQNLYLWLKPHLPSGGSITNMYIEVTDTPAKYFGKTYWFEWETLPPVDVWTYYTFPLGEGYGWGSFGSPSWDEISGFYIRLHFLPSQANVTVKVDGGFFGDARYSGSASDATAPNYGNPDLEVVDDALLSDTECSQRAEALLLMKKTPPVQAEITVVGNKNVLLGDRVPLTIPAEDISAEDFDIYIVENTFVAPQGFLTKATMVNSVDIRQPVIHNQVQALVALKQTLRKLGWDEKTIV